MLPTCLTWSAAWGFCFRCPDGEEWRTAMINLPVFPFQTPQAFYDNLVASQPDPKTGKPDPEKMAAFPQAIPKQCGRQILSRAIAPSSGFDNTAF